MWAELRGKLSSSSESPQDRLEDTLTDAAFSALKYLPRVALRAWLESVLPPSMSHHAAAASTAEFEIWPTLPGGTEPDLTLIVGNLFVVVEAKYRSPFSPRTPRHQLEIEWDRVAEVARQRGLDGPVVVAVTAQPVAGSEVDLVSKQIGLISVAHGLSGEEAVRWSSWQRIALVIESMRGSLEGGVLELAEDVLKLMEKREVRFVFEGFEQSDLWLVAAAADSATQRVYPRIATFARELLDSGKERGLIWGGSDAGVVWGDSKQLDNNRLWHRNYIQLPFWSSVLPRKRGNWAALYVLFGLNRASIHYGGWFQVNDPKVWEAKLPELTSFLNDIAAEGFSVGPEVLGGATQVRLRRRSMSRLLLAGLRSG